MMRSDNSQLVPHSFRIVLKAGPQGSLEVVATGLLWLTELSVYNRIQKARVDWDLGEGKGIAVQSVVHYLRHAPLVYDTWVSDFKRGQVLIVCEIFDMKVPIEEDLALDVNQPLFVELRRNDVMRRTKPRSSQRLSVLNKETGEVKFYHHYVWEEACYAPVTMYNSIESKEKVCVYKEKMMHLSVINASNNELIAESSQDISEGLRPNVRTNLDGEKLTLHSNPHHVHAYVNKEIGEAFGSLPPESWQSHERTLKFNCGDKSDFMEARVKFSLVTSEEGITRLLHAMNMSPIEARTPPPSPMDPKNDWLSHSNPAPHPRSHTGPQASMGTRVLARRKSLSCGAAGLRVFGGV